MGIGSVEEYIRLRNMTSPEGMWIMPRADSHQWDGVYFCRKGPLSPSIIRFTINDNAVIFGPKAEKHIAQFRLAEDPNELQSFIKDICDRGEIHYDKLKSFQYDALYTNNVDDSCLRFDTNFSLKELYDKISS